MGSQSSKTKRSENDGLKTQRRHTVSSLLVRRRKSRKTQQRRPLSDSRISAIKEETEEADLNSGHLSKSVALLINNTASEKDSLAPLASTTPGSNGEDERRVRQNGDAAPRVATSESSLIEESRRNGSLITDDHVRDFFRGSQNELASCWPLYGGTSGTLSDPTNRRRRPISYSFGDGKIVEVKRNEGEVEIDKVSASVRGYNAQSKSGSLGQYYNVRQPWDDWKKFSSEILSKAPERKELIKEGSETENTKGLGEEVVKKSATSRGIVNEGKKLDDDGLILRQAGTSSDNIPTPNGGLKESLDFSSNLIEQTYLKVSSKQETTNSEKQSTITNAMQQSNRESHLEEGCRPEQIVQDNEVSKTQSLAESISRCANAVVASESSLNMLDATRTENDEAPFKKWSASMPIASSTPAKEDVHGSIASERILDQTMASLGESASNRKSLSGHENLTRNLNSVRRTTSLIAHQSALEHSDLSDRCSCKVSSIKSGSRGGSTPSEQSSNCLSAVLCVGNSSRFKAIGKTTLKDPKPSSSGRLNSIRKCSNCGVHIVTNSIPDQFKFSSYQSVARNRLNSSRASIGSQSRRFVNGDLDERRTGKGERTSQDDVVDKRTLNDDDLNNNKNLNFNVSAQLSNEQNILTSQCNDSTVVIVDNLNGCQILENDGHIDRAKSTLQRDTVNFSDRREEEHRMPIEVGQQKEDQDSSTKCISNDDTSDSDETKEFPNLVKDTMPNSGTNVPMVESIVQLHFNGKADEFGLMNDLKDRSLEGEPLGEGSVWNCRRLKRGSKIENIEQNDIFSKTIQEVLGERVQDAEEILRDLGFVDQSEGESMETKIPQRFLQELRRTPSNSVLPLDILLRHPVLRELVQRMEIKDQQPGVGAHIRRQSLLRLSASTVSSVAQTVMLMNRFRRNSAFVPPKVNKDIIVQEIIDEDSDAPICGEAATTLTPIREVVTSTGRRIASVLSAENATYLQDNQRYYGDDINAAEMPEEPSSGVSRRPSVFFGAITKLREDQRGAVASFVSRGSQHHVISSTISEDEVMPPPECGISDLNNVISSDITSESFDGAVPDQTVSDSAGSRIPLRFMRSGSVLEKRHLFRSWSSSSYEEDDITKGLSLDSHGWRNLVSRTRRKILSRQSASDETEEEEGVIAVGSRRPDGDLVPAEVEADSFIPSNILNQPLSAIEDVIVDKSRGQVAVTSEGREQQAALTTPPLITDNLPMSFDRSLSRQENLDPYNAVATDLKGLDYVQDYQLERLGEESDGVLGLSAIEEGSWVTGEMAREDEVKSPRPLLIRADHLRKMRAESELQSFDLEEIPSSLADCDDTIPRKRNGLEAIGRYASTQSDSSGFAETDLADGVPCPQYADILDEAPLDPLDYKLHQLRLGSSEDSSASSVTVVYRQTFHGRDEEAGGEEGSVTPDQPQNRSRKLGMAIQEASFIEREEHKNDAFPRTELLPYEEFNCDRFRSIVNESVEVLEELDRVSNERRIDDILERDNIDIVSTCHFSSQTEGLDDVDDNNDVDEELDDYELSIGRTKSWLESDRENSSDLEWQGQCMECRRLQILCEKQPSKQLQYLTDEARLLQNTIEKFRREFAALEERTARRYGSIVENVRISSRLWNIVQETARTRSDISTEIASIQVLLSKRMASLLEFSSCRNPPPGTVDEEIDAFLQINQRILELVREQARLRRTMDVCDGENESDEKEKEIKEKEDVDKEGQSEESGTDNRQRLRRGGDSLESMQEMLFRLDEVCQDQKRSMKELARQMEQLERDILDEVRECVRTETKQFSSQLESLEQQLKYINLKEAESRKETTV